MAYPVLTPPNNFQAIGRLVMTPGGNIMTLEPSIFVSVTVSRLSRMFLPNVGNPVRNNTPSHFTGP
jgi:hypothetical protein